MNKRRTCNSSHGFSAVEMITVCAVIAVISAIAIPQMLKQRRLMRSVGMSKEIMTQLRYTRQLAMSQRQVFTFQYDDTAKQMKIIDNNYYNSSSPGSVFALTNFPNNTGSAVVQTIPFGGLNGAEMNFGIPSGYPTAALGDSVSQSSLTSGKLNISFQPNGTVVDSSGNYANFAIYIYNSQASVGTASAISVLGASGRIKIWRYDSNANKYSE